MRQRAAKIKREKAALKPKPPRKPSFDKVLDLRAQKPELEDEIAQLKRDMEQEAEAEGGEIANRYGAELEKLEAKLAKIDKALDVYDLYESINEGKEISKGKIDMMGSKIFSLIKIGTEFVTDGGNYIITGFGQKSNAFQEYEAEKDGKPCKVKLTAMYGIKLEVTDDPKSAVYRKEERLNSIILESIKETKKSTTSTIAEKLAKQLKEAKAPKTEDELKSAIEDAERKIEKHAESLAKIDSAPGGGNWSSSSAEGKKSRKLKDAQGKLRDKIDTYTKKLKKLK
jgi:DNA-binding protein H-NS